MFLRRNRKKHKAEDYDYWTLVESVRTSRGPRQRVVAMRLGQAEKLENELGKLQASAQASHRVLRNRDRAYGDPPRTARPAPAQPAQADSKCSGDFSPGNPKTRGIGEISPLNWRKWASADSK